MATIPFEREAPESATISDEALRLAEQKGVVNELFRIGAMTEELFPGKYLVDVHHDPEIPNYSLIDFQVVVHGTAEEAARQNSLWHERLVAIAPNRPCTFCLTIDFAS